MAGSLPAAKRDRTSDFVDHMLLQDSEAGCTGWAVRCLSDRSLQISLNGWSPLLVPEYFVSVVEEDSRVTLDVRQGKEQQDGDFWFTSSHGRRVTATLSSPLAGREVVDPQGLRLPVVEASRLLEPPAPWQLVHEEYQPDPVRAWASGYDNVGLHVGLRQGPLTLGEVPWDRPFFPPQLVSRPLVRGHEAVLYGFEGDDHQYVLAWKESDRGVTLQSFSGMQPEALASLAASLMTGDPTAQAG